MAASATTRAIGAVPRNVLLLPCREHERRRSRKLAVKRALVDVRDAVALAHDLVAACARLEADGELGHVR
jgi:hypothetical protein